MEIFIFNKFLKHKTNNFHQNVCCITTLVYVFTVQISGVVLTALTNIQTIGKHQLIQYFSYHTVQCISAPTPSPTQWQIWKSTIFSPANSNLKDAKMSGLRVANKWQKKGQEGLKQYNEQILKKSTIKKVQFQRCLFFLEWNQKC